VAQRNAPLAWLDRHAAGGFEALDMKTALAALMGIVALGGFAVRQWLKYQHQTLKYHMELTENIYFRNVNNNAGIFDYLIATAEDQETKEAVLAYHFIHKAEAAPTADEIALRIETWLVKNFGVRLNFAITDAQRSIALDSCDVRASGCPSRRSSPTHATGNIVKVSPDINRRAWPAAKISYLMASIEIAPNPIVAKANTSVNTSNAGQPKILSSDAVVSDFWFSFS
jgi:Protein of unknown function (DUF3754)